MQNAKRAALPPGALKARQHNSNRLIRDYIVLHSCLHFAATDIVLQVRLLRSDVFFRFLRQGEVENHAHCRRDGKTCLHYENNGIIEALERLVVTIVCKNVRKVCGHECGAVAKRQAGRQDEAVAASKDDAPRDNGDAGHGDGREEERGHAANDGRGNGDNGSGELGKDAHDDEKEAASVASPAIGAARQSDDAVVLRECAHRRHGHEAGEQAIQAVGQDATLDA